MLSVDERECKYEGLCRSRGRNVVVKISVFEPQSVIGSVRVIGENRHEIIIQPELSLVDELGVFAHELAHIELGHLKGYPVSINGVELVGDREKGANLLLRQYDKLPERMRDLAENMRRYYESKERDTDVTAMLLLRMWSRGAGFPTAESVERFLQNDFQG